MGKNVRKDYAEIQSTKTIVVTPGIQYENETKKDSDIPNRMKVNPVWQNYAVKILEGKHVYPSAITEWPTVKALVEDKVLTIGNELDSSNESTSSMVEDLKELPASDKHGEVIKDSLEDLAEDK